MSLSVFNQLTYVTCESHAGYSYLQAFKLNKELATSLDPIRPNEAVQTSSCKGHCKNG